MDLCWNQCWLFRDVLSAGQQGLHGIMGSSALHTAPQEESGEQKILGDLWGLGGDPAGRAGPNWPQACPIPHNLGAAACLDIS